MKKKILKHVMAFAIILLIATPVIALATTTLNPWGDVDETQTKTALGLGDKDPREIAATVINVLLGFLGIIAVIIILIGGFKWMTAGGNDDKTSEARKLISAGVIGLIIILASFGIATFVIDQLLTATGAKP